MICRLVDVKTRQDPVSKPLSPEDEAPLAAGAQLAIAALALLGLAGGWLILLSGGFHHQVSRRSSASVWVDGGMALFMAAIFLSLAAIALAVLLHRRAARRMLVAGLALVLLPPLVFVLSGGF